MTHRQTDASDLIIGVDPQADLSDPLSAGLESWWLASRLILTCLRFLWHDSIICSTRYMRSPVRPSVCHTGGSVKTVEVG